jgi:NTE family protein
MKRGLVHSGGGRKGAFGVGVVKELVARGVRWQVLRGTSVGAINLSKLAMSSHSGIQEQVLDLEEMWLQLRTSDVWKSWTWGLVSGLWRESFYNSEPLWRMLERELRDELILRSGYDLAVGCVEYSSGLYFEATPQRAASLEVPWWKYVAASSSYPAALRPVALPEGVLCGDGGAVSATPLKSAIDAGCDVIDIILTDPMAAKPMDAQDNVLGTKLNALSIAMRTIDLLAHSAMVRDVERCLQVNEQVLSGEDRTRREVQLNVFFPSEHLTKSPLDSLDFDAERSAELIGMGERAARLMLELLRGVMS